MNIRRMGGNKTLAGITGLVLIAALQVGLAKWTSLSEAAIWVAALVAGTGGFMVAAALTDTNMDSIEGDARP